MIRLALSLTVLASFTAQANDVIKITSAEVVEYGIYRTAAEARVVAPGTSSGELTLLAEPRLVRATQTVPALLHSSFGIRYRLEGAPIGAVLEIRDVIKTPGLTPDDGETTFVEERADIARVGETHYLGYTFEEAWERVPGKWTFEVWYRDQLLLAQEFDVVKMRLQH